MQSFFDKPAVSPDDIEEVAGMFSRSRALRSAPMGGVPNTTYRVEFEDRQLAIRIGNTGYTSTEHLEGEIRLLSFLEKRGYAYSPRVVVGLDGDTIQVWRGFPVIATDLIHGTPGDQVFLTPDIAWDLGDALASLRIQLCDFEHNMSVDETYVSRGSRLVNLLPRAVPTTATTVDVPAIQDQFEMAHRDIEEALTTARQTAIHTDVWPPNILVSEGRLSGIIDFDDFAIGPPILDIAAALCEVAFDKRNDSLVESLVQPLLKGYRERLGLLETSEAEALVPCIVFTYASWLASDILHAVPFEQWQVYYRRLEALRCAEAREHLSKHLRAALDGVHSGVGLTCRASGLRGRHAGWGP